MSKQPDTRTVQVIERNDPAYGFACSMCQGPLNQADVDEGNCPTCGHDFDDATPIVEGSISETTH